MLAFVALGLSLFSNAANLGPTKNVTTPHPSNIMQDDEAEALALDWDAKHRRITIEWEPHVNETDWVGLLARLNHPPSRHCRLPPTSDNVPNESPIVLTAHEILPNVAQKRVAWFFVLGFNPTKAYEEMVKSVVLSARIRATALEPYFLYVMNDAQHQGYVKAGGAKGDKLASWMVSLGVRVVAHVISFAHARGFEKEKAQGAQWARLDLFKMAINMRLEFLKRGLLTTHVLYTDMDLFFSHDPPLPGGKNLMSCGTPYFVPGPRKIKGQSWSKCTQPSQHGYPVNDKNWPYIFGAGTEVFVPWGMNSGVMYINVQNASLYSDNLIKFAISKGFRFSTADQQCLELFFQQDNYGNGKTTWDWLDDAVVNSRGFIPPAEFLHEKHIKKITSSNAKKDAKKQDETLQSRSAIWHWHGYKANQIRCLFDRIKDGSWDVTKNTDTGPTQSDVPGCQVVTGNGKFNMGLRGCYLVTYAWMLSQHERLQSIARTMRLVQEGAW